MDETAVPTVLIVDDDQVNRTLMAVLLQDDCRVLLAKDGESALRRVQEEDVALILLDVSMPGMDGYEVLRRLRAERRTEDLAVIFITALTDEQDEERGLLLGATDYVFKPIRPAIVRTRILHHLKSVMQRKELERLTQRDGLTNIFNRRHFDTSLQLALRHAARSGEPLSVAIIDVDHFKMFNDRYGHPAGDDALCRVARILESLAQRPYDIAARYGGEEFALLLPGVDHLGLWLEELRHDVAALGIPHADSPTAEYVTISGGGVVVGTLRDGQEPALLVKHADQLLYRAKKEGRNRMLVERVSVDSHGMIV